MKLILSRKGFDSESGGIPSPILPDGSLCSLPIPSSRKPYMTKVRFGKKTLSTIANELSPGTGHGGVHLDPDLNKEAVPRKADWRPAFGQVSAAQSHLGNQQVGKGDLFLFFGWFRPVIDVGGRLTYQDDAQETHCLFGWLQVGSVYHPGQDGEEVPPWAAEHPHVRYARHYPSNNTLYVAEKRLYIPGLRRRVPGGGIFASFEECLQLTEPGKNRSVWRLPSGFYPKKNAPSLSYHSTLDRWQRDKRGVLLKTVGRGQEFVLDCDYYPEVIEWVKGIFETVPIKRARP